MKIPFFGRVLEIRAMARSEALTAPSDDSDWAAWLGARGYTVSAETALKVAAVFRCVDIISKTIAALPLNLFEQTDSGKRKAREHPLHNMLYVQPNRHTTAYEMMQMYVANLLLTRGAFLRIKRDRQGFVRELWNIPTANTSSIQINSRNGERYIYVTSDATTEILRDGDFVYTPAFRFDDDKDPDNPMRIAGDVLGLNADMTKYAQKGFSGVNPGGFITYPASMSDKSYERFKNDFLTNYNGVANAGKWLFLEDGAKAQPWERDMERAQLLESRKWAVTEVCRIFGVPPHLCMDMEHATFSNIEQQSLEFVRDCINPLSVRIEQTLYKDLLTEEEKKRYYFKFNTNGLLRGDTQTRTQYYNTMRQTGVLTANEVRRLEDMNDMPPESGADELTVNGNMIPLSMVKENRPKGAKQNG